MEKRKPHCPLSAIKALVQGGKVRATRSAIETATELGVYNLESMAAVVMTLTQADFYKSMTRPMRIRRFGRMCITQRRLQEPRT